MSTREPDPLGRGPALPSSLQLRAAGHRRWSTVLTTFVASLACAGCTLLGDQPAVADPDPEPRPSPTRTPRPPGRWRTRFCDAQVAVKRALGEHAKRVAVNSTKSMTGHLLGAAGGVEAVFTILALRDQVSPPTINLQNQDPQCDLDYVANTARKMRIRAALSNSFGFGGTNGTLVFVGI